MSVLAAAASSPAASIVAAAFAGASALITAIVLWRAQSSERFLRDIGEMFQTKLDEQRKQIRKAIREATGAGGDRRWYDRDDS